MALTVRPEPQPDFGTIAVLANEAFGGVAHFTATRLQWLYQHAFAQGARVLGLYADDRKVGQVTLLGQSVRMGERIAPAVALVDLFILPAFRSRDAIATLYGAVETTCRDQNIRFILAVPNGKAVGVNRRFLGLDTAATLDIRVALPVPVLSRHRTSSWKVGALDRAEAIALLSRFVPPVGTGLGWTAEALWGRLQDPSA